MSNLLQEHRIECPYCGETLTILIDTSAGNQSYIEDCQVCCQPIDISFATDGDAVIDLQVHSDA